MGRFGIPQLTAAEREWRRIRATLNGEGDAWRGEWYKIVRNAAKPKAAKIYVYGEIGWEVTSASFAAAIDALDDVSEIDLRINSPGGSVFEGLAVYNTLKQHAARIVGSVDGLAASAASFIAMACDELTMGTGSQMMIHDAAGFCMGQASDMRELADILDRTSDEIAGFYARKAGGSVSSWRDAMKVETWYTGDEAVRAELADGVAEPDQDEPDDAVKAVLAPASFDLSVFAYAGREVAPAPAPTFPAAQAGTPVGEHGPELEPLGLISCPAVIADPQVVDDPVDASPWLDIAAAWEAMQPRTPWTHLVPKDSSSSGQG